MQFASPVLSPNVRAHIFDFDASADFRIYVFHVFVLRVVRVVFSLQHTMQFASPVLSPNIRAHISDLDSSDDFGILIFHVAVLRINRVKCFVTKYNAICITSAKSKC